MTDFDIVLYSNILQKKNLLLRYYYKIRGHRYFYVFKDGKNNGHTCAIKKTYKVLIDPNLMTFSSPLVSWLNELELYNARSIFYGTQLDVLLCFISYFQVILCLIN